MSLLDSRLRASVVLAGFIVGIAACTSGQRSVAATPPAAPSQTATVSTDVPNLYEAQRQVDEYIRSGRYDKDVAKVIVAARAWLEERAKTAVKPAIVLDIDETSLSNWPAYRINGWGRVVNGGCDLQQGPCGLRAWQALGQSKAIPATLALARRARVLGVAVSSSVPVLRICTRLQNAISGARISVDRFDPSTRGAHFASAADFKAPERRKIAERGYTIVLSLGDQESDLKGGYAERTFKLPNPVYYLP